jgi:hypothetical protein
MVAVTATFHQFDRFSQLKGRELSLGNKKAKIAAKIGFKIASGTIDYNYLLIFQKLCKIFSH